jgi:porphyrinogen peroxidase
MTVIHGQDILRTQILTVLSMGIFVGMKHVQHVQKGILAPVPPLARYLSFTIMPEKSPAGSLRSLCKLIDGDKTVVGLGQSFVRALGREVPGLDVFPGYAAPGLDVPSTPASLWCWLRGNDRGELVHRARSIVQCVTPALQLQHTIDGFRYKSGFDLSGYEDGTENPKGAAAVKAVVVTGQGAGLDGGSFVAVQQWVHNLDRLEAMTTKEQDHTIGRRKRDNKELGKAPASAHVKRTAQESFDPAAFIVRRSMPWAHGHQAGLVFVAFGNSFDAFDALLRRMVGADDGIVDALFTFTRPISGSYFWCPPIKNGSLDLRAVGL